MISSDFLGRLLVVLRVQVFEMVNLFTVLDPAIKNFIGIVAIAGPLSIAGVIFLLKKIEKTDPDRIRWK
tara:strand:+ start:135 stop:341 length:207 start_codon:yes stop_codon:yes gene_type:complete